MADLQTLLSGLTQPRPSVAPMGVGTPDPYTTAIQRAKLQYPWMKRFGNIVLTQGTGAGESESYMPTAEDNPKPGNYTVQLRKAAKNQSYWPALLGRESIDWLARSDPRYQAARDAFVQSMSPDQLRLSRRAYERDKKDFPGGVSNNFNDWLRDVQAQEYMGAYLVPESAPGWTGPKGEGQYTPEQIKLLDGLKTYLHG